MADHPMTVFAPQDLDSAMRLADVLSKSSLLPPALRGKPQDVLIVLMTGAELRLSPMMAIRGISVVNGKAVLEAATMMAVCLGEAVCEYFQLVSSTDEAAVFRTQRRGSPEPTEMTYTLAEAKQAELLGKDNWRKHPAAMLRARCASALARAVYPDLLAGVYETDEGREIAERRQQPTAATQPTAKMREIIMQQNAASAEAEQPTAEVVDVEPEHEPDPWLARIEACTDERSLNALAGELAQLPDVQRSVYRAAWKQRQAEVVG